MSSATNATTSCTPIRWVFASRDLAIGTCCKPDSTRGIHADAVGREEEWLANRLAERANLSVGKDQPLSNGRWVRVEDRRTKDGGVVGIRVDITELKQREAELELQNIRFDTALNNMVQGLSMFDAEQRLVVCNDRYAQMYGLPPELTKPGTPLRQIFDHRSGAGLVAPATIAEYDRGGWLSSTASRLGPEFGNWVTGEPFLFPISQCQVAVGSPRTRISPSGGGLRRGSRIGSP